MRKVKTLHKRLNEIEMSVSNCFNSHIVINIIELFTTIMQMRGSANYETNV